MARYLDVLGIFDDNETETSEESSEYCSMSSAENSFREDVGVENTGISTENSARFGEDVVRENVTVTTDNSLLEDVTVETTVETMKGVVCTKNRQLPDTCSKVSDTLAVDINTLANDVVAKQHISLLSHLCGEIPLTVIWKMLYLTLSQDSTEKQCTMLCVVSDYLVSDVTLLAHFQDKESSGTCHILQHLSKIWEINVNSAKKGLTSHSYSGFIRTLQQCSQQMELFHLKPYFQQALSLAHDLSDVRKETIVLGEQSYSAFSLPGCAAMSLRRLRKILDAGRFTTVSSMYGELKKLLSTTNSKCNLTTKSPNNYDLPSIESDGYDFESRTPDSCNLGSTPDSCNLVSTPDSCNLGSTPDSCTIVSTPDSHSVSNLGSTPDSYNLSSSPDLLSTPDSNDVKYVQTVDETNKNFEHFCRKENFHIDTMLQTDGLHSMIGIFNQPKAKVPSSVDDCGQKCLDPSAVKKNGKNKSCKKLTTLERYFPKKTLSSTKRNSDVHESEPLEKTKKTCLNDKLNKLPVILPKPSSIVNIVFQKHGRNIEKSVLASKENINGW